MNKLRDAIPTTTNLGIGIHTDISPEEYHADPCEVPSLSSSIAKILVGQSPAHAWLAHPRLGFRVADDDSTEVMDMGSVMHALLLKQNRNVLVIPHKDFRKKEAQELRDSARERGAIPILEHKLLAANEATGRIIDRLQEKYDIGLTGDSEVVLVWDELATNGAPVRCRAMVDHLIAPLIMDFKITKDASWPTVERRVGQMGYQVQGACYVSALEHLMPELAGRIAFELFFCEPSAPHGITRADLSGEMMEMGQMMWQRAVNTWAKCLAADYWPDYPADTLHVQAQMWAFNAEMEKV